MATIKDIAKAAGVSHGTVSNVLNNRGNVSAKKIALVEKVAIDMGYNLNKSAQRLRKGAIDKIAIIIPTNEIKRYRDFYISISEILESNGYVTNLYISDNIASKEKEIIETVLSDRVHTIVIISSLNKIDDFYKHKAFGNTKLIFVEREMTTNHNFAHFISYNPETIGKEIGAYVKQRHYNSVIYFSCRKIHSFENTIFSSCVNELINSNITVNQHSCDNRLDIQKALQIISSNSDYDAIITTSLEKARIVKDILIYYNLEKDIDIISITSASLLPPRHFTSYELDYQALGTYTGQFIANPTDHTDFILPPDGFVNFPEFKCQDNEEKEITILCIDGLSSKALCYLAPIIKTLANIKINVISEEYDTFFQMLKSNQIPDSVDLVRMDMVWLSTFGPALFKPLSETNYNFDNIFNTLLPELEQQYSIINGERYTFPFDPSMQLLFYRKDLFEDAITSRTYFETFKQELTPPQTFYDYNQIASFFTRHLNDNSSTLYGTTLVADSPQSIACQFIPIYRSLGGDIQCEHNSFVLNRSIIETALDEQLDTFKYISNAKNYFWGDAMAEFAAGHTAMSITFSNRTANVINSKVSNVIGKFGFSILPGNTQLIGGGVLGISKKTTKDSIIGEFLEIFYSKKIALMFAYLCGASSSKYAYNNADILRVYPWLSLVKEHFRNGKRRYSDNHLNEFDFEFYMGNTLYQLFNNQINKEDVLDRLFDTTYNEGLIIQE